MFGHDMIVLGASTGGVEALSEVVAGLPADLPAAVFIVLHVPPHGRSFLPEILSRMGRLPAEHPDDGDPIAYGRIYVAPPDYHLLVTPSRVRVVRGPTENRLRPAVDMLFRSAAHSYGPRVVGIVLTGALDDGTAGLYSVKQHGGVAIVQDPAEALIPSMPESALEYVAVDYCLPIAQVAPRLVRLAYQEVSQSGVAIMPAESNEGDAVAPDRQLWPEDDLEKRGGPSVYTCPECNGPLWEIMEGDLVRYRCRVGHGFTSESLLAGQSEQIEDALWEALNTLEASAGMARQMARQSRDRHHILVAERFEHRAQESEKRAKVIRRVLLRNTEPPDLETTDDEAGTPPPSRKAAGES